MSTGSSFFSTPYATKNESDARCRARLGESRRRPVLQSSARRRRDGAGAGFLLSLPPVKLAAARSGLAWLGWVGDSSLAAPSQKKRFHCTYWSSTLHCNASHRQQLPGNMYRRRGQSKKKKSNGPKFILRPAKITVAFTACQRHTAPFDPWVDFAVTTQGAGFVYGRRVTR